ncbi:MAG: exodeoxyribonuclease VII large subunit [Myxococcales bacterium]|nr:exodeoxyribonuclease VII large subunit [Myxococcales bacterium]
MSPVQPAPAAAVRPPPASRAAPPTIPPSPAPAAPQPTRSAPEEPRPWTVAELDRAIRTAVEDAFRQAVWVEGEVADARPSPSGHLYFCLKDEREEAAIDVVAYRSSVTPRMRALCVDGARVRVRGKPTFWAPRGRMQLIADRLQAAGRGALLEALERLKAKLAAEGLFAAERKRPLPAEPRVVGVVTSAGGAVIHDICRVAFRRGGARILLAAAQVQGPGAAASICRAISQLQRVRAVDVIVVGRGGGSADDLGAFNEEVVVRAVAACRVPVVSAVGHDVDVTLVDFAADARAATPSQAAEMVVPDRAARRELLRRTQLHMARAMRARLAEHHVALARVARRVADPRLAIAGQQQTLDDRVARLTAWARATLARRREAVTRAQRRLAWLHPRAVIARERAELTRVDHRLRAAWGAAFERRTALLLKAAARLDALSPVKVLARGYCIVTRDGRALRSVADVRAGEPIDVRASDGHVSAMVTRAGSGGRDA